MNAVSALLKELNIDDKVKMTSDEIDTVNLNV